MVVKYDDQMIANIVDKVDLLEYVRQDMEFEQHGREYFAHCPKHVDLTPSFSITPENNRFYCFSCHRGGTIINYLMMYENMSFDDAVKKAAQLADIDMSKMCTSQTVLINRRLKREQRNKVSQKDHQVLDWNIYDKFDIETVPEWINEGIKPEILKRFDIRVDNSSNRIVYPVFDMEGRFINVKGRTRFQNYKALKVAKYINYYPVGVMDYLQGYTLAKEAIHDTQEVKVFESIKSVMKMFGENICDCVSAETHNLTIEQIQWLIKIGVKNVVLCWDSDVSYASKEVQKNMNMMKRFMNVYIVPEIGKMLGGPEGKNSPIDCGIKVWNYLYAHKQKIV